MSTPAPLPPVPNKRSAFTLIELLTVLAIAGVLAALIFSGWGRLNESGRSARCLSNLRQQGLCIFAYAADHKGCGYPVYTDAAGGTHWNAQIHLLVAGGYVNEAGIDALTDPVQPGPSIFCCPSGATDRPAFDGVMVGTQGAAPDDEELNRPGRWEPYPPVTIPGTKRYYDSWYSWNADNVDSAALPLSPLRRLNTISRPARTVLVVDGPFALHLGYTRVSARHGSHRDRINTLFADGHVQSLGVDELFDPVTRKTTDNYIWTIK